MNDILKQWTIDKKDEFFSQENRLLYSWKSKVKTGCLCLGDHGSSASKNYNEYLDKLRCMASEAHNIVYKWTSLNTVHGGSTLLAVAGHICDQAPALEICVNIKMYRFHGHIRFLLLYQFYITSRKHPGPRELYEYDHWTQSLVSTFGVKNGPDHITRYAWIAI